MIKNLSEQENLKLKISELSGHPTDQDALIKFHSENPNLFEKEYRQVKETYYVTCPVCGKSQIGSGYLREYDFWHSKETYDTNHHCIKCGHIWNTDPADTVPDKSARPSVLKPWLKYYSEEAKQAPLPEEDTAFDYMFSQNKAYLSSVALNYFGHRITYKTLFDQIRSAADSYSALGIACGDTVALVTLTSIPSVVSFYALNQLGAMTDFLNVTNSADVLKKNLIESQAKVVFCMDIFAEKVQEAVAGTKTERIIWISFMEGGPTTLKVGYAWSARKLHSKLRKEPIFIEWKPFLDMKPSGYSDRNGTESDKILKPNRQTPCYLAHTSGTTGKPKSVLLSNHAFNVIAQSYLYMMPHKRGEVFLNTIIPFVVYAFITNVHMPLCLGLETVLIPHMEAEKWPEYIRKYHPNHTCSVKPLILPLMHIDEYAKEKVDLSCLKTVGLGGEGMSRELEEQFNAFLAEHGSSAKVQKGYGLTETCATAAVEPKGYEKIGSVGIPLVRNTFMIYDNDRQTECGFCEQGEICIQAESMMNGYLNHPEETDYLFRIHPDGSRWLHTEDIGYMDEDGFLYVVDRMKRMIMVSVNGSGCKVFPNQVEEILNQHENVHESCVVAYEDPDNKEIANDVRLRAFIVKTGDQSEAVIEQELRHTFEQESVHIRPYLYSFLDKFPLNSSGKVDYRKLQKEQ